MALAVAELGVQAIFWFLERSPGTSRPSGLCPDVTPSRAPLPAPAGGGSAPLPTAAFMVIMPVAPQAPAYAPVDLFWVFLCFPTGASAPRSSVGAFSILSRAVSPAPGRKQMNYRTAELPADPRHLPLCGPPFLGAGHTGV